MIAWLVAEVDNRLRLDGLVARAAFRVQKAQQFLERTFKRDALRSNGERFCRSYFSTSRGSPVR